jgi:hypothetical protein
MEWKLLMEEREGCERTEEALLSSLRRISKALIGRSNVNHRQNHGNGTFHMGKTMGKNMGFTNE